MSDWMVVNTRKPWVCWDGYDKEWTRERAERVAQSKNRIAIEQGHGLRYMVVPDETPYTTKPFPK